MPKQKVPPDKISLENKNLPQRNRNKIPGLLMKRMDKLDKDKFQLMSSINKTAEQSNNDVRLLDKCHKNSDQFKNELTRAGKTVFASPSDTDIRHQDTDALEILTNIA